MPHASYDPLRLSWYLGYIHNVYCKGGGGGERGLGEKDIFQRGKIF